MADYTSDGKVISGDWNYPWADWNALQFTKLKDLCSNLSPDLYSLSGGTTHKHQANYKPRDWTFQLSYRSESWQTAPLPRNMWHFRTIGQLYTHIAPVRDFVRSNGKTCYKLVNCGLDVGSNYCIECECGIDTTEWVMASTSVHKQCRITDESKCIKVN